EFSGQRLATNTNFDSKIPLANAKADLTAYRLNLLYNFRQGQTVRPFVTVGVGCEHFDVHQYGESQDRGWNAGGGVRWFMTPNINWRLDARYVETRVAAGLDETQRNYEGTVGVGWVFGAGKTPLP